jgi:hypothetical protein
LFSFARFAAAGQSRSGRRTESGGIIMIVAMTQFVHISSPFELSSKLCAIIQEVIQFWGTTRLYPIQKVNARDGYVINRDTVPKRNPGQNKVHFILAGIFRPFQSKFAIRKSLEQLELLKSSLMQKYFAA